ncbi:hypothetical protein ACFL08_04240 [Patescibacteria group bacterium]
MQKWGFIFVLAAAAILLLGSIFSTPRGGKTGGGIYTASASTQKTLDELSN